MTDEQARTIIHELQINPQTLLIPKWLAKGHSAQIPVPFDSVRNSTFGR